MKKSRTKEPIETRLLNKSTVDSNGCWIWEAAKLKTGYGLIEHEGKLQYAHRVALEVDTGVPIPDGMCVRHVVCHNPSCINPDHLAVGTAQENSNDSKRDGRYAENGAKRWKACPTRSRFSRKQIANIKAALERGVSGYVLAKRYKTSEAQISSIRRGKIHKDVLPTKPRKPQLPPRKPVTPSSATRRKAA